MKDSFEQRRKNIDGCCCCCYYWSAILTGVRFTEMRGKKGGGGGEGGIGGPDKERPLIERDR